LFLSADLYGQQQLSGNTSSKYLNIPIGSRSRLKLVTSCQRYYLGNELVNILPRDLKAGKNELQVLPDITIAEIFLNQGTRYIVKNILTKSDNGVEFIASGKNAAFMEVKALGMKSVWNNPK